MTHHAENASKAKERSSLMGFRSNRGLYADNPPNAVWQARIIAGDIKLSAQALRSAANSATPADKVLKLGDLLSKNIAKLDAYAATPGLAAYVQVYDPAYDIAAEFAAMRAAINSVIAWIRTNTPMDGNGKLLVASFAPASALLEYATIPEGPLLTDLCVELDALISTID